jgi:L-cysteine:1D-myo-inositol 2-amino-2-deoxy-alpha-D-glucopyranoside ligase
MQLYNSLTKKIENFKPLSDKQVSIYVCGITPYDTTHLGHAFTYIQFDALIRFLTSYDYKVTYTQNVTDIDDDILKRADRDGMDWQKLGQFWTDKFLKDLKSLNIRMPDYYTKATDYIVQIVQIVQLLIEKKQAYEKNGNVYFDISTFPKYGQLSGFSEDQMKYISSERGADPNDPNKKNPLDFILWTASTKDQPGWDSPWSRGRPGWHIECSAMAYSTLGKQIDIHGGGRDLVYPHHESEIAQSESYTGKAPYVKTWMHTAMLMYQGEKMSKSLGNMLFAEELLKKYSPNTIRWVLLSHHYRAPWEFQDEMADQAQEIVTKFDSLQESDKYDKAMFKDLSTLTEVDLQIFEALKIIQQKLLSNPSPKEQSAIKKYLKISGFIFN